jgi:hypothetical protein
MAATTTWATKESASTPKMMPPTKTMEDVICGGVDLVHFCSSASQSLLSAPVI